MPRPSRRPNTRFTAQQRLIDGMRDAAVVIAADGDTIVAANRASGELSGCTTAELIGRSIAQRDANDAQALGVVHDAFHDRDAGIERRCGEWPRADGSRITVEYSAASIRWRGRPATLLTLREQIPAASSMHRRLRQQAAVAELGQRALATADLDRLLSHAATSVHRALDSEYVSVLQVLL
ncbi:MAG TPA: PAS domain S-box protein, partial [Dehalococcoidia bacterium]|nr:PAS domain S-box protein [Dehalococcoidia bacterium]